MTTVDLRRSVPVRIVADIDAPDGQPGDMEPRFRDGELWGFANRCVGCGLHGWLPVKHTGDQSGWTYTGDPRTGVGLTLSPSVWSKGECGWHGWLRSGMWVPC